MNQQEDDHEQGYTARCIEAIDKEHGNTAGEGSYRGSGPIEVVKRRPKVRGGTYLEQEASQVGDEECHEILRYVRCLMK